VNPESITDLLEPLRTPESVSWWPPAPGWWILAILIVALLAFALHRLLRYHRRGAPLREARRTLDELARRDDDLTDRVATLARLQRQVAIRLAGRSACAGLTGSAWADFLNSLSPGDTAHFDGHLAELPYRPVIDGADWQDALEATRAWLDGLERPA